MKKVENLVIKNAHIFKRNFSGVPDRFNKNGDRTFLLYIDDENVATNMVEDGWNVKILAPREEGDTTRHYIAVKVAFEYYPPKIILCTRNSRTPLDEDTVGRLDKIDIANVDVSVRPRVWTDDAGNEHIKAYLKTLYVTMEEDEFADDYDDDEDPFN